MNGSGVCFHSSPYPRGRPHHACVAYALLILFEGFMKRTVEASWFEEDCEIRKTYIYQKCACCLLQQNCHQRDGSFFSLFSRYSIIISSSSFDSIVAIYASVFIFF
jgi:hypothetical protein